MADPTAWVALALYLVERVDLANAESLSALVGAADIVDTSILGVEELVRGLSGLSARGWLDVDASSHRLANEVIPIVAATVEETGFPSPRALAARLAKHPCFVAPAVPPIDPVVFKRAVDLYVARTKVAQASRKR